MKIISLLSALILLVVVLISSGCAPLISATSFTAAKFPWSSKDEPKTPNKLTCIWTHTILNQMGKTGVRGFGGRVMFYTRNQKESIKVEGTLTVYAFDDSKKHFQNSNPDRKYVFLPDQLEDHYSKSDIGHSYSIWIPWDEVGGDQKQVSLIARFEPKEGTTIMTESTRKLLPGITRKHDHDESLSRANDKLNNKVELLSHEEESESESDEQSFHTESYNTESVESFTLNVPKKFAEKHLSKPMEEEAELRLPNLEENNENNEGAEKESTEQDQEQSDKNSEYQTSELSEQSDDFSQTRFPARKRQDNLQSVSRERKKPFRGWSPESRPSLTERYQSWKEKKEETETRNLPAINQN
jgi:hypothetical protein